VLGELCGSVLQVLERGAKFVARGTVALPQQGKNNSADMQRSSVNITDFI
jgi:hypothetical protein